MKEYVAYLSCETEGIWEIEEMEITANSIYEAINVLKEAYFVREGYDDDMECYDGLNLDEVVIYPKLSGLVVDIAEWKKELDEKKNLKDDND